MTRSARYRPCPNSSTATATSISPISNSELPEVIARARAAGVTRMVTICTRLRLEPRVRAIAEAHDGVFYAAGTHPMSAAEEPLATVDELVALSRHPKFVGIGETGLDYHYTADSARCSRTSSASTSRRPPDRPAADHPRPRADDDMARILTEEFRAGAYACVMHCFSSGPDLARAALDLGFYLSMSGIATFPKSPELRDIFAAAPLDRILLETDSPYLAPPPHRGKRNEPAYTAFTAAGRAAFRPDRPRIRRRHQRQFRPPLHQGAPAPRRPPDGPAALHHPWLRLLRRRAAPRPPRRRLGRLRPHQPAQPPPPLFPAGGTRNRPRRHHPRADRHLARHARTAAGRRRRQLDAVIYTHSHADHVHGIDDLRQIVYNIRRRLPVWADGPRRSALIARFGYAFVQPAGSPIRPSSTCTRSNGLPSTARAAPCIHPLPIKADHGSMDALGFRIGPLAYLPDAVAHPRGKLAPPGRARLLDRRRAAPQAAPTHAHLALTLDWIARAAPRAGADQHAPSTLISRPSGRTAPPYPPRP
jgi:TatD DNase family protein